MSHLLESLLTPTRRKQATAADAAMLGLFGFVAQHSMPCVSDADPAEGDWTDEEAEVVSAIAEARGALDKAEALIAHRTEAGLLGARSCLVEARGWLESA